MMTTRGLVRASLVAFALVAAFAATRADSSARVAVSVLRFSSYSTQSMVDAIVSNPSAVARPVRFTVTFVGENGVPHSWTLPSVYEIPPGNYPLHMIVPYAIAGPVRIRATDVGFTT